MTTIWKFPLSLEDRQYISMPSKASILTLQTQEGQPCLWALVDSEEPKETITIRMFGTGHSIKAEDGSHLTYLGTFQIPQIALVFHVFREQRALKIN